MTHQPANRPRIAATYASGTVRARRWHGDGDVRGYRPPRGWTARADLTDLHPLTGRALPRAVWWIIETKGHAQGRSCAKSTKPASVAAHRAANDSTEPRRNGRGWCGYAPACCGRLHESVPSPTLAVRCLYVTKDGSPTRRPASLLWSFHTTPQYVAVSCGRGALALSSGH